MVGVQVWPLVHVVFGAVHVDWITCVQTPVVETQQEPCGGWGQMLGEQLPLLVQVLAVAQLGWVEIKHEPEKAQQLPVGGPQGLGEQVRLAVQTLGAAQYTWKSTTHPPSAVQHVPVAGHEVAEHATPATKKLGNEQVPASPAAHVPSEAQHAPVWAHEMLGATRQPSSATSTRERKRLERDMDTSAGLGSE